jgi:hypothetical protein
MEGSNNATTDALEARRIDDEAAAIAVERIRSGAAEDKEDGVDALRKLGIQIPSE